VVVVVGNPRVGSRTAALAVELARAAAQLLGADWLPVASMTEDGA
jgi:NAD(P)H-dependent FMN reductase